MDYASLNHLQGCIVRKIMKFRITFLIFVSFVLLAGCIITKPPGRLLVHDNTQDVYIHKQSGFLFPSAIGSFKRDSNSVIFYDESGNDFSVPYNLVASDGKAAATIYISYSLQDYSIAPIPKFGQTPDWFLKDSYNGAKNSIMKMYNARLLSEGEVPLNRSLLNPNGKRGAFEWDTVSGETVYSHLYLFAHKGWLVKYRFSYPSKYHSQIEPQIESFINSFQWP